MASQHDSCRIISGEREVSRADISVQAALLAAGLANKQIGKGDAVAYLLRNDFPCFVIHQAAQLLGFDAVPVNWHLKPLEVAHILEDCAARVVVVHRDLLSDSMLSAIDERIVIVVTVPDEIAASYPASRDLPSGPDQLEWANWLSLQTPLPGVPDGVVPPLFYTSGSSGTPKAVVRAPISPEKAAGIAARTRFAWGFDQSTIRSVMTGPLYHSAPNGYAHMVLAAGELLLMQPRFDAQELLELIERYALTHLHLVPTMFSRLLALTENVRTRYDLSSLQFVTHGAAPCPPEVKRRMINWWGPVIHEYYAMTETGIIACSTSAEWLTHPGSVGRPAPGVEIVIRSSDGAQCATRAAGTVCVRHEATDAVAYGNDAEKTARLRADGFLITGDVGYLDEDGFLYLTDRESDMIISGGVNIYPAEIEAALATMPAVRDSVVFGLPDPDLGEKVVAVLETEPDVTAPMVVAFLAEHLANFKIPRRFEFTQSLPREDSGKIKKREIAALYR